MTEHVVAALAKRRAELSGEADALRTRLAGLIADIGHIDAVIRQIDPSYDLARIRPRRPRAAETARLGDRSRALLDMLREAGEPLSTAELVQRLMEQQKQDTGDRRLVTLLVKRIGTTLTRQERRGAVRAIREEGRVTLWEVAR